MIKSCLSKAKSLLTPSSYNFIVVNTKMFEKNKYNLQGVLDHYSMKLRKLALERSILEKEKVVLKVVRLRRPEDTLDYLRKNKLCAACITGRDEFEDIDVVFESKQIFALRRRKDSPAQSYYIDVGGESIRVVQTSFDLHRNGWIVGTTFSRYIPGRPNPLVLPVYVRQTTTNKYLNTLSTWNVLTKQVWVNCYNDEYPTAIDIDLENMTPSQPIRIGDLQNLLPPGLEIHNIHRKELTRVVIELTRSAGVYQPTQIDTNTLLYGDDDVDEDDEKPKQDKKTEEDTEITIEDTGADYEFTTNLDPEELQRARVEIAAVRTGVNVPFDELDLRSLKPNENREVTEEDIKKFENIYLKALTEKLKKETGITNLEDLDHENFVGTQMQQAQGEGEEGEGEEQVVVEKKKADKSGPRRKSYKSLKKRVQDLGFKVDESKLTPNVKKEGGEAAGGK